MSFIETIATVHEDLIKIETCILLKTSIYDVSDGKLVPYAASMSSQYYHLEASRCIDGNTVGDFENLCHTDVNSDPAPWLLLKFQNTVEVTRVEIYNRNDSNWQATYERTRNVEVRLTDELPTTGDTMYTGGQLLGTFKGPATQGQIISVNGSAKTGRNVLIQMNHQDVLHFHEVSVFRPGLPKMIPDA